MKRFKSVLCASLLTLAMCSISQAGIITTAPERSGIITTRPGIITTIESLGIITTIVDVTVDVVLG
jgi:hypothetical protein